jgi:hypothetical protein
MRRLIVGVYWVLPVVTALTAAWGWLGWRAAAIYKEDKAAAILREYGAMASIDASDVKTLFGVPITDRSSCVTMKGNAVDIHLAACLPDLKYLTIESASLPPDAGLCVSKMGHLEFVRMGDVRVDDEFWPHLEDLRKTRWLEVVKTPITDAGLRGVGRLTALGYLDLSESGVTDEGLEHLHGLVKLYYLYVRGCPINGAGLRYLNTLPELCGLCLAHCKVTDEGLENLPPFPLLADLDLSYNPISDKSVKSLARLELLRNVNLNGTKITDAGLASLAAMGRGLDVTVKDTKVTDAGMATVQHQHPSMKIHRSDAPEAWQMGHD